LQYRLVLPQVAIVVLFRVRPETLNERIRDIRQLLDQAGHTIQPGPHLCVPRISSVAVTSRVALPSGRDDHR
jgi:hypothetical protein